MKTTDELKTEWETLKTKHKDVYTIEAPTDDEGAFATIYLRKCDRMTYAVVVKMSTGNDPLKAVEYALNTLYIGGDELKLVLDNEDALMSCEGAIVEMLAKKSAVLKKN